MLAPLFSFRLPSELKRLNALVWNRKPSALPVPLFLRIAESANDYVCGRESSLDDVKQVEEEELKGLFVGVLSLLRALRRVTTRKGHWEAAKKEAFDRLAMPDDYIEPLKSYAFSDEQSASSSSPAVSSLADFDWRVDVNISSASLQRVLRPTITITMKLGDGTVHTFEMDRAAFQSLRYKTAKCLQTVTEIAENEILKIK